MEEDMSAKRRKVDGKSMVAQSSFAETLERLNKESMNGGRFTPCHSTRVELGFLKCISSSHRRCSMGPPPASSYQFKNRFDR